MRLHMAFAALAGLLAAAPAQASSAEWISGLLSDASRAYCGAEEAAISGTLSRLRGLELPDRGRALVVNIPAGIVTAYEDGVPVIESRAVVGRPATPTPEMQTRVTYVRANPTWTVPESIVERNGWRQRLADDPGFFEDNGFDVEWQGRLSSPWEASADPWSAGYFVQRPGPGNALGLLKIGLADSNAIYLHDTNEPGHFGADLRTASAGCVRMEEVRDIAAWIMETGVHEIDAMIDSGVTADHRPPSPVAVILGYWTAWPDADGSLRFYPDIYGLDGDGASCGGHAQPAWHEDAQGHSGAPAWGHGSAWRAAPPQPPSAAPSPYPGSGGFWTEHEGR